MEKDNSKMNKLDIQELLNDSNKIMEKYSLKYCVHDYVDEEKSCCWYHSVWQYLRSINCVSAPQWHQLFYEESFEKIVVEKGNNVSILISGTADYSLLHILVEVLFRIKACAHVFILDKCRTPLEICKYYKKELLSKNQEIFQFAKKNIHTTYIENDLFKYNISKQFDIICTDAFLTRFNKVDAQAVLNKWRMLLDDKGAVITTVRVHKKSDYRLIQKANEIEKFEDKVIEGYQENPEIENQISMEDLLFLANRYIIKMHSYNIGDEEEIKQLFNDNGFGINYLLVDVSGEINPTQYMQIVARRF